MGLGERVIGRRAVFAELRIRPWSLHHSEMWLMSSCRAMTSCSELIGVNNYIVYLFDSFVICAVG